MPAKMAEVTPAGAAIARPVGVYEAGHVHPLPAQRADRGAAFARPALLRRRHGHQRRPAHPRGEREHHAARQGVRRDDHREPAGHDAIPARVLRCCSTVSRICATSASIASDRPPRHAVPEEPRPTRCPAWLSRVSARRRPASRCPIVVNGEDFGKLVIAPRVVRRGGRDLGLDRQLHASAALPRHRRRLAHELDDRPSAEADPDRRRRADGARRRQATTSSCPRGGHRRSPTSAASSTGWRRRWRARSRRTGGSPSASFACRTRSARIWRASCTTSSALSLRHSRRDHRAKGRDAARRQRPREAAADLRHAASSAWKRSSA